jgi:PAS domain S-box-containing protein
MSATRRCLSCQHDAFPQARYCSFCGTVLASAGIDTVHQDHAMSFGDPAFSAELFRKLVDFTNDAIHVVDPTTSRFLDVNQCACDRLGYTREEMLTLRVIDVQTILPDELSWAQHVSRMRASDGTLLEGWHRRKDGSTFPAEINIRHVTLEGQHYFVAVARDVTERKRSEDELRDSQERFRLITESIQEVFWIADTGISKNHYISPAYEKIWGRSCQELIANPRSFLDSVHPEDRARVVAILDNRAHKAGHEVEYRIIRPDGAVRWIHDRGFPTAESSASMTGFVGACQDITDRKLADEKLRESEERYRTLFETCADGVFILDLTGRILAANAAARRMHGYELAELLALNIRDLTVPADAEGTSERLKRLMNGEALRFEVFHLRKDGTTFPEEVIATPLRIGGETYVLSFERDITAQAQSREREKILRDELAHAARLRTMGEMAAGIAHELNQPLGALVLYADHARRIAEKLSCDELQNILRRIEEQSLHAGDIVRRMRAFIKRVPPSRIVVDLNRLVREVVALMDHDLRHNGVRLGRAFAPRSGRAHPNPASDRQPRAQLRRRHGQQVSRRPHSVHSLRKSASGRMCQRDRHRLRHSSRGCAKALRALSNHEVRGDGNRFVNLSNARSVARRIDRHAPKPAWRNCLRLRHSDCRGAGPSMSQSFAAYIVDDDAAFRDALEGCLQTIGVGVRSFDSAKAFLDAYDADWSGHLFVDLNMAGMNGLEMLEELGRRGTRLQTILITGRGSNDSVPLAQRAGVCAVLYKPFSAKTLEEVLRRA